MLYDKDIREPLFEFLEGIYGKTRMIEEKIMGRSRADVVMVTEEAFYGVEIKSDADSYARLSRQVRDYDEYFDYNLVAVGATHALHIEEHVPAHWGIITVEEAEGGADFYLLRRPKRNGDLNVRKKLSLLWRPELARLLLQNGLPAYRDASKQFVIRKLDASVPYPILARQMSEELFERDYTKIAEEINRFREEVRGLPSRRGRKPGAAGTAGKGKKKKPDLLVRKVVRHAGRKSRRGGGDSA